jgi:hypothetical protein
MMIFSIDPGPHTGIAWFDVEKKSLDSTTLELHSVMDFAEVQRVLHDEGFMHDYNDVLIVENFKLMRGTQLRGDEMLVARLLGVIEWCYAARWVPQPSSIQQSVSRPLVVAFRKEFTPYGVGMGVTGLPSVTPHEVSAIKHMIYWMRYTEPYRQDILVLLKDILRKDAS